MATNLRRESVSFRYAAAVAAAVQISDLQVRYGPEIALDQVELSIPAGRTVAVIGPNGSGKSSLLRAIAGLARPSRGSAVVDGEIALVLQATDVDRSVPITVREAVTMARYPSLGLLRRLGTTDRSAIDRAMERLSIRHLARRQLHHLSGGQRQRVLVAQGLAQEADVLLLDEPVTGLDVVSRQSILDVVDEERDAGRTVLMTTHQLGDARRCNLVVLLATRPVAIGPPDEVLQERHLAQAFGGSFLRFGSELLLDDPHHDHGH
jgi:manganese transport system ATP-binding protein